MSDTVHVPSRRRRRSRSVIEYKVYFWLIFLISLPGCLLTCDTRLDRSQDRGGPFARARAEANRLTPFIFSA